MHPEVVGGQRERRHRSTVRKGWMTRRKIRGRAGRAPLPTTSGCTEQRGQPGRAQAACPHTAARMSDPRTPGRGTWPKTSTVLKVEPPRAPRAR